jgi:outer membrane protein assembly factor BamB
MSDFIYNGRLYSYGYSGELIAYDIQTGNIDWVWSAPDEGLGETFYPKTPLSMGCIADGKVYMYTSEHSPTMPLRRDANIW